MNWSKQVFNNTKKELMNELGYKNPFLIKNLQKIVINSGIKSYLSISNALNDIIYDLKLITGQKCLMIKSKRSNDRYKIKIGELNALKITLRRENMWNFCTKLSLALSRDKSTNFVTSKFDSEGNYTMGIKDHSMFYDVNKDLIKTNFGFNVTFVFDYSKAISSDIKKKCSLQFLRDLGYNIVLN